MCQSFFIFLAGAARFVARAKLFEVEMWSHGHLSALDRKGPFSLFLIRGKKASPCTR